eukprot:438851_1
MVTCSDIFASRTFSITYDIFTATISVLDVITDIVIMAEFYIYGRMPFFYSSLAIIIIAQLAYCIAFWWKYADIYSFCNSLCIFMVTLPFAPVLSFVFYFTADPLSRLSVFLENTFRKYDLEINSGYVINTNKNSERDKKLAAFREWTQSKLYKHLGFIIEALIESFPQAILQLIAIVYYNEYNAISIFSILLSMISVSSKSLILSV